MSRFQQVAVLKGGPSAEREVSLASGAAISEALRGRGYTVHECDVDGVSLDLPAGVEAVFIALHGTYGEDGSLQAQLEARGMPFTGSGSASSRLAFDKVASKRCFDAAGIPTPAYEVLEGSARRTLPLPLVVKPPRQGSSIGISKVFAEAEWPAALEAARAFGDDVLVEAFIEGRELTVGIVGGDVFPVVEIRAPDGYYDYRAKYTKGLTQYLVPAPLEAAVAAECQELAQRVFSALGCRGLGRVDIRLTPEGRPYVLELNSIPGFTGTSLLPKAAQAAGISFPDLCEKVLDLAAV